MYDLVAIGSTTVDAFWKTDFKLISYPKTPSGKALAIPLGEKFGTEDVYYTLGGNAANASVTFAREGFSTALFTTIGKGARGQQVREWLLSEHVDSSHIEESSLPTSESVILLQNGERSIITRHGAINEFHLDSADLDALKARWWYLSLPGESYKALDRLLKYAGENNINVALNPSWYHLAEKGHKDLMRHLASLSVLVLNRGEAAQVVGIPFEKKDKVFDKLDELVPGIVVVTGGREGVVVSDGSRRYRAGIFKESSVVDRTGAGDAFGSGFVAGLFHQKEKCNKGSINPKAVEYAIRLASANATSVVERIGSTAGIITAEEFEKDSRWKEFPIESEKI